MAMQLISRGYRVAVLDPGLSETASKKAAGLYNPITGRKMVKTWMARALFDFLEDYYPKLEQQLGAKFFHPMPIYRPFQEMEEQNDWLIRDDTYARYIRKIHISSRELAGIIDPIGGLELQGCGWVDVPHLVTAVRNWMLERNLLHVMQLNFESIDWSNGQVAIEGMRASRILFCEGPRVVENPLWQGLRWRPVRGDILHVSGDFPTSFILNRNVFVVPRDGTFWVGSTYDHERLTYEPQSSGLEELSQRIQKIYSGSFVSTGAHAGVRPATYDRKPFIGWHQDYNQAGIFNGFGSKGVSLVPYFANLFIDSIEGKQAIIPEVNVNR